MAQSNRTTRSAWLFNAQACTHGNTATANVDTLDAGRVTINVNAALAGAGTAPTLVVSTSDSTATDSFVTAGSATVGTAGVKVVVNQSNRKRYVRIAVTAPSGSTNSNATLSAVAELYDLRQEPASTTDMVQSSGQVISVTA